MPAYTDYDDDSTRLPEGFKRTGYDADTQTYSYTYTDNAKKNAVHYEYDVNNDKGNDNTTSYTGLPGNRYGPLYPSGSPQTSVAAAAGGGTGTKSEDDSGRHLRVHGLHGGGVYDDDDRDADDMAEIRRKSWWQRNEWRMYLLPFLMLISVFLLLFLKWIFTGSESGRNATGEGEGEGDGRTFKVNTKVRVECAVSSTNMFENGAGAVIYHTVDKGDTCWDIARKYHVDLDALSAGFVLTDDDPVSAKKTLADDNNNNANHGPDDAGFSRAHATDLTSSRTMLDLDCDDLDIGQIVCVKQKATQLDVPS